MPRGGINTLLRITFVITQTKPALIKLRGFSTSHNNWGFSHIKKLVLPITLRVAPFGPKRLSIKNPTTKICKATFAGI